MVEHTAKDDEEQVTTHHRVMVVVGTRPEGIKMVPLIQALRARRDEMDCFVCSTGQHKEMLQQVLDTFEVQVDIDLELMRPNQTLPDLSARALIAMTKVIQEHKPTIVAVQGDTTTAMIAAMAAFYEKVPVAHIEAGLRTHTLYSPFPEEMNRHVIGVMAKYHFAATDISRQNLLAESTDSTNIHVVGNTVIDALYYLCNKQPTPETQELLDKIGNKQRYVLVTAHRRENHGDPMRRICTALKELADKYTDVKFVFPVHLNPKVQEVVKPALCDVKNIMLTPPQPYEALVHLQKNCHFIITDSGGIQEEGIALNKPVIVLRESTERPEGVDCGGAVLVGTNKELIVDTASSLMDDESAYDKMAHSPSVYGDGKAAQRCVDVMIGNECEEFVPH